MTIHDFIKTLPYKKAQYVRYYFNLWFDNEKQITEEEFLKTVQLATMNTFNRYRKSEQWKHIVILVLESKTYNDLLAMYNAVSVKARQGDSKSIDTLLKLQRQIDLYKESSLKSLKKLKDSEEDVEDELEL